MGKWKLGMKGERKGREEYVEVRNKRKERKKGLGVKMGRKRKRRTDRKEEMRKK